MSGHSLKYCPDLKNDKEIVLKALETADIYDFLSKELQDDLYVARAALKKGVKFHYLSETVLNDKEYNGKRKKQLVKI
jgi:hypothetical protein